MRSAPPSASTPAEAAAFLLEPFDPWGALAAGIGRAIMLAGALLLLRWV